MPREPYATRDDLFNLGLSAQAFVTRARPVPATDLDTTTGVIRLEAHGMTDDDAFTFAVTSGGALPTSISAFVAYGVSVVSSDLFLVVDPGTGNPITSYASAGSGWAIKVDPARRLDMVLVDVAGEIDDRMTAYAPPFERDPVTNTYPQVLVGLNARLGAWRAATTLQFENAQYRVAVDRLEAQIDKDWENLATYLAGRPINPTPTDQTTTPENGGRASRSRAPVDWSTGML